MIVVDASMAISWLIEDDSSRETESTLDFATSKGSFVPGNFYSEITHALLKAERHGRIDDGIAASALDMILSIRFTTEFPIQHVVLNLARAHGLTAYDASYLAVALQRGLPLATKDTHLRNIAQKLNLAWNIS